jgi:hypothetical protein
MITLQEATMSKPAKAHVEDWQIVYRTIGLLSAQAVQGRLQTAGIPSVLDYDGTSAVLGIPTFGGTGEVRVLVPFDRMVEARGLLGPDANQ